MRDELLFLDDILESITNIEEFSRGVSKELFTCRKMLLTNTTYFSSWITDEHFPSTSRTTCYPVVGRYHFTQPCFDGWFLTKDKLRQSAIVRQLEIIGEAVKNISNATKTKHPEIEWRKIAGSRDIFIHEYFGVNLNRVWDVIKSDVPALKKPMQKIKEEMEEVK